MKNVVVNEVKETCHWEYTSIRHPDVIICYHNNCLDGILAAGIAATIPLPSYESKQYLLPITYDGKLPFVPEMHPGAVVYFVDFCPDVENLVRLLSGSLKAVHIYDHHDSSLKAVREFVAVHNVQWFPTDLIVRFSENQSGAMVTAFETTIKRNGTPQRVFDVATMVYGERYDLWLHEGKLDSDETYLAAYFTGKRKAFGNMVCAPDKGPGYFDTLTEITKKSMELVTALQWPFTRLINDGKQEFEPIKAEAEAALAEAVDYMCSAVEQVTIVKCKGSLTGPISYLANQRKTNNAFTICFYEREDGTIKVSLRAGTKRTYKLNVLLGSVIPGAGGHQDAAGGLLTTDFGKFLVAITSKKNLDAAFITDIQQ